MHERGGKRETSLAREMWWVARRHCSEETHGLQCFVWVGLVHPGRNVHVHRLASLASDGVFGYDKATFRRWPSTAVSALQVK